MPLTFRLKQFAPTFLTLLALVFLRVSALAADDYAGPVLGITSHVNGATVNAKTITLSGTATDAGQGGSGIRYVYARGTVAGSTAVGSETISWSQSITLNKGANTIEVTAYDNSPQQNATTRSVVINFQPLDTLPPTVTISSHADGAIVNVKTITISGTATDAGLGNNGIKYVYLRGAIPNTTVAGGSTASWSKTVELNRGANTISVSAYDNSDVENEGTKTIIINFQPVDPLPPTLTVTSHQNGQTVGASSITLQGTATDAGQGGSGIKLVYVQGNLPNSSVAGGGVVNWSKTISLRPGANSIYIYAYDASDVENEALQTITINFQPSDTLSPSINITSHTTGQTVRTSTITLQGTATDAGRGGNGISSVYVQGTLPNSNVAGTGVLNWSKNIDLRPGANTIYVYAYDAVEFPNEAYETIVINFEPADSLAPAVTVTSHADGQQVASSEVTITGTATDAGRGDSGISAVYLRGNIPNATATGAGVVNWSRTVTLNPGQNTLYIFASDNAPFPNQADLTLTLQYTPSDALAPNLSIASPADNATVSSNTIVVAGTASDAGRGDNGIAEIYVNSAKLPGATAAGGATVNWSKLVVLNPGRNTINVTATDNAPFPLSTNKTITVFFSAEDSTGPAISIESHRNNQVVASPTITLAGTATDNGSGNNGVKFVKVNGTASLGGVAEAGGVAAWSREVALVPGDNIISVVAEDTRGNSGAATLTVVYTPEDALPPTVQILSHNNGQVVSTSSITILGTATDQGSGGSGIASVLVNGGAAAGGAATGGGTANWSRVVDLIPGANVISAVAKDGAQNSASASITVNYQPNDITPPSLEITSHRKEQVVLSSAITLAGSATDARLGDSGIASVTVNGAPAIGGTATGGGVATWNRSLELSLGANVISVVAKDGKGNSTASTLTIHYQPSDITAPNLEVVSHKNGQTVNVPLVTLTGFATDKDLGDSGILKVMVNDAPAQGGAAVGAATAFWSHVVQLTRGDNIISITASDNSPAQNTAAKAIVLTYDPAVAPLGSDFCWARNAGGDGNDQATAIAVDAAGNSYVTGSFEGTASFAATNVASAGMRDIFVAKYAPSGALLWVRTAGGLQDDVAFDIDVDAQGNCFITGYYQASAFFGGATLRNTSSFDLFVAKYSTAGQLVWAANSADGNIAYGRSIKVKEDGKIMVAGAFHYDFDLGGDSALSNNEFADAFVAEFSEEGWMTWINQLGGEETDVAAAVTTDQLGNSYVTGHFQGEAYFGADTFTATGTMDTFLAKLDADGFVEWARQGGGLSETQSSGVATDLENNSYITGYYRQNTRFSGSSLASAGDYDLFLAKHDPDGRLLWATNAAATVAMNGVAVAVDAHGHSYVTGSLLGPLTLGGTTYTNDASSDIFVAVYDANGRFETLKMGATPGVISGFDIDLGPGGDIYVAGTITGGGTFGSAFLAPFGESDAFLGKIAAGLPGDQPILTGRVSGGAFEVSFLGDECHHYALQGSEDLRNWTTLQTFNSPTGTSVYRENDFKTRRARFYRVVIP